MSENNREEAEQQPIKKPVDTADLSVEETARPKEYGGPRGKEPTRYGDWERKGRCIDF